MSSVHALTMPKWGLAMKEGRIARWLVEEGVEVRAGAELVEIETEKILSSVEAPVSGVLRRRLVSADDVVPVAGLLGVIADASIPDSQVEAYIADFQAHPVAVVTGNEKVPLSLAIVDVQGQRLRYLRQGEGGEAALLIHGFGGDLNNWLFNHQVLASNHIVYALDLPGHGESSKRLASGTLQEFVEIVQGFLNAVGLASAHLVGHSMGGAVAIEFASAHPANTLSLALIASAGLGPEINGVYINGFMAANRRKEMKPVLDLLFADSGVVTRQLVESVLKYKRLDGTEQALRVIADKWWPEGRQLTLLRDRLSDLSVPVLAVWGAEDRILPVSHAEGLPKNVRTEILAHATAP